MCPFAVLLSLLLSPAHHPQTSQPKQMGARSTSSPQSPSSQPRLWGRERQAEGDRQAGAMLSLGTAHSMWHRVEAFSLHKACGLNTFRWLPKSLSQHPVRAHRQTLSLPGNCLSLPSGPGCLHRMCLGVSSGGKGRSVLV